MEWKKKLYVLGAVLVCTSLMLATTTPPQNVVDRATTAAPAPAANALQSKNAADGGIPAMKAQDQSLSLVPNAAAQADGSGPQRMFVEEDAPEAEAVLVAEYPVEGPGPELRDATPGAVYSNITNYTGFVVTVGGVTSTSGTTVTQLLADDLQLTANPSPDHMIRFNFSVYNSNATAFTAQALVRFFADNANTPGTYLSGYNFGATSYPAGTVSYFYATVNGFTLPTNRKLWMGTAFLTTTGTLAQRNGFGVALFDPPTVGSSLNEDFLSTANGGTSSSAFTTSNPAGTVRQAPYSVAANHYYEVVAAPYCVSGATSTADDVIQHVTLNTIDNESGIACATYTNFTAISTNLARGLTYPISVVSNTCGGNYSRWLKVFIDWNADIDFDDAGEQVFSITVAATNPITLSGNITVPVGATLGATRMRLVLRESGTEANTLPCGTYSWGETEDYTINVVLPVQQGACCNGVVCTPDMTQADCLAQGGGYRYMGDGSVCTPNPCMGACCYNYRSAECTNTLTAAECTTTYGGTWYVGQDCATYTCPPYCTATSSLCDEYVSRVQLANIDNSTACTAGGYADYTGITGLLCIATNYTITVTNGLPYASDQCGVWIDWNGNGLFTDAGEAYAMTGSPGNGPYTGTITPPTLGTKRMRVRIKYTGALSPCGNEAYGETEDYTLNVVVPSGACCLPYPPWCQVMSSENDCTAAGGTWKGYGTSCSGPDCQPDGIPDICQLTNNDCNNNGIPDECEVPPIGTGPDCNSNGIPDDCEVAVLDCNDNGVPDDCDITEGNSTDYDDNGVPDECDPDCNGNFIPDACELPGGCDVGACGVVFEYDCGLGQDCQPDGILDECQLGKGVARETYQWDDGTHENSIGLTSGGKIAWMNHFNVVTGAQKVASISVAWGTVANGTSSPVYLWSDPNGDGNPTDGQVLATAPAVVANANTDTLTIVTIPTTNVGGVGTSFFVGSMITHAAGEYPASVDQNSTLHGQSWICGDSTGNLDPNNLGGGDVAPVNIDTISGLAGNWLVRAAGAAAGADCNHNNIPDECDINVYHTSLDCQPNGIPDECELDCNGNDIPDDCDITNGTSQDCNDNGVPDECDPDCNGNGTPDDCDMTNCDGSAWCSDCNDNGVLDWCDIDSGNSPDCQGDGIPDECQLSTEGRAIVWDNGPLATGTGCTGQLSLLQSTLGLTLYGLGAQQTASNSVADDFALTQPCQIDTITVYTYQTGSTPPTITSVVMQIWNGPPNAGGAIVWGDMTTNRLASCTGANIFRTLPTTDCSRHVQAVVATVGTSLSPGTYWVQYSFAGTGASGPWAPPVTILGLTGKPGANALQNQAGTWVAVVDATYPQDFPFVVEGTCGPLANDCNGNGVPDECDIGTQWGGYCTGPDCSSDYNGNGVPDECELCGDFRGATEGSDPDGLVDINDYNYIHDGMGYCLQNSPPLPYPGDGKYAQYHLADMDGDNCITMQDFGNWVMCYRMANGKDFVPPAPKPPVPMPKPKPVPTAAPAPAPTGGAASPRGR